jgi:small subunit ribosomal protein S2
VKNRVEIFDLEKTVECLEKAKEFVKQTAINKGQILFIGGKSEAKKVIMESALKLHLPYVAGRWLGGTLTNFSEIRKRIEKMESLISQREKGELVKYTKKERLILNKEIEKLSEMFSGLVEMKELPKALFVIDSRHERNAIEEAKKKNIPVVALTGSDCDLAEIDFPIPANDASLSSIRFFVEKISESYREGRKSENLQETKETNQN